MRAGLFRWGVANVLVAAFMAAGCNPISSGSSIEGSFGGSVIAPGTKSGLLTYLEMFSDAGKGFGTEYDGLNGNVHAVVSADGRNVYVAGQSDSALVVFTRSSGTGMLTPLEAFSDVGRGIGTAVDGLQSIDSIALSPDGSSLYVTGQLDDALVVFDRNTSTGVLTYRETFSDIGKGLGTAQEGLDGAYGVAVSPDGLNVYAVSRLDAALIVFDRNTSTGALTFREIFSDVGKGFGTAVDGLNGAEYPVVSPDGANVYVGGNLDDALVVFDRNSSTGALTYREAFSDVGRGIGTAVNGLDGATQTAISPDGRSLYITGAVDDALLVFDRSTTNGSLTFREIFSDVGIGLGTAVDGLNNAYGVVVAPDGLSVYTVGVSDHAVLVFSRNTGTGALTYVQGYSDAGQTIGTQIDGLGQPAGVAVSLDGNNVYVTTGLDDAVLVFRRD